MKKGKMFLGLVAALAFVLIAIPAMATTINWSDGIAHGNQGLTLIPNADLTITAKSSLGDLDDPLWIGTPGTVGTVYWGKLGKLDVDMGADLYGLGVQNAKTDMNGNLDPGGSNGISGGGGDANEALIFTFANPPGVNVNNGKLELIGLNYSTDMNGDPTDKADVIDLFLEFTPLQDPSDYHYAAISFSTPTYLLDLSTLGLTGDFGSFSVAAINGHFGVGSIEYTNNTVTDVPEPATMLLLGIGLVSLRVMRRRSARK